MQAFGNYDLLERVNVGGMAEIFRARVRATGAICAIKRILPEVTEDEEFALMFRDEAKDPERTIPRATYIALILIGLFYTLSSWVLISANGESTIVQNATDNAGTILAGVTRDTALTLLRGWGHRVSERAITIDEVSRAHRRGRHRLRAWPPTLGKSCALGAALRRWSA